MEERKRGVSVQQVKQVLNQKGKNYSDEEVKAILDFLYLIGEIEYQNFLNTLKDEEKSNPLHQSILRRPG